MDTLTDHDRHYLELCIQAAADTFKKHCNYPVGAALVIDDQLIQTSANQINTQKSFVHHAENQLIIDQATTLYQAYHQQQTISLYSTLEPCIQCLGAAVTNHITRIIYIQPDPNGGACALKHDHIGLYYREFWPQIIHAPISDRPLTLMRQFFHAQIAQGNREWPKKMLALLQ